MDAREFIPKNKNGLYSRNAVETLAESYAEYKNEQLQNKLDARIKEENNIISEQLKTIKELKKENERLKDQLIDGQSEIGREELINESLRNNLEKLEKGLQKLTRIDIDGQDAWQTIDPKGDWVLWEDIEKLLNDK